MSLKVKKMAYAAQVNVDAEGQVLCPCCKEPMRANGKGAYECSIWGPISDELYRRTFGDHEG